MLRESTLVATCLVAMTSAAFAVDPSITVSNIGHVIRGQANGCGSGCEPPICGTSYASRGDADGGVGTTGLTCADWDTDWSSVVVIGGEYVNSRGTVPTTLGQFPVGVFTFDTAAVCAPQTGGDGATAAGTFFGQIAIRVTNGIGAKDQFKVVTQITASGSVEGLEEATASWGMVTSFHDADVGTDTLSYNTLCDGTGSTVDFDWVHGASTNISGETFVLDDETKIVGDGYSATSRSTATDKGDWIVVAIYGDVCYEAWTNGGDLNPAKYLDGAMDMTIRIFIEEF